MPNTLASDTLTVTLPDDATWIDRRGWSPVSATATRLLTGALLVEASAVQGGRPVSLLCRGVTDATLAGCEALAAVPRDETDPLTLTLHGQTLDVIFRPGEAPLEVAHIWGNDQAPQPPDSTDRYTVTLRLMEV